MVPLSCSHTRHLVQKCWSSSLTVSAAYISAAEHLSVALSSVTVMLQNLLRRRVLEKVQSSGESTAAVSLDDSEVILRRNKQAPGKQRQRITSCPDPARLKELQTDNINMLDLRTICERGEQFLTDQQQLSGELFSTDSETDKENEDEETFNSFTEENDRSVIPKKQLC